MRSSFSAGPAAKRVVSSPPSREATGAHYGSLPSLLSRLSSVTLVWAWASVPLLWCVAAQCALRHGTANAPEYAQAGAELSGTVEDVAGLSHGTLASRVRATAQGALRHGTAESRARASKGGGGSLFGAPSFASPFRLGLGRGVGPKGVPVAVVVCDSFPLFLLRITISKI